MKIIVVPENKAQYRQKFEKKRYVLSGSDFLQSLPNKIGKIPVIIVLALTTLHH